MLFRSNHQWVDYIMKHHADWVKWINEKRRVIIKREQLVIVRGALRTTEWTVAAFQASGTVRSNFGPVRMETKFEGDVQYRSGPEPKSSAGSIFNDRKTYDQCVFLPMYKIKYRIVPFHLFPLRIEAAAEYDNLGDPEDDNANAPAPMIVTEGDEEDELNLGADNVSIVALSSSSRADESLSGSWSSRHCA